MMDIVVLWRDEIVRVYIPRRIYAKGVLEGYKLLGELIEMRRRVWEDMKNADF